MKEMRRFKKPHARYDFEEEGFICLICEEAGFEKGEYYSCEILRHLKEKRKIDRKQQDIADWNEECEKEYLKKGNRPLTNSTCI